MQLGYQENAPQNIEHKVRGRLNEVETEGRRGGRGCRTDFNAEPNFRPRNFVVALWDLHGPVSIVPFLSVYSSNQLSYLFVLHSITLIVT